MTHMPAITKEEVLIPPSMFNIDDEFTPGDTTEEEEDDEKSNNYYDNIDNKILQNEESTLVFEDNSLEPTTVTNKKKKKQKKAIPLETQTSQEKIEELTQLLITVVNLNVDTMEYIHGMLSKDFFDEWDTRERVRGILMEKLSSQSDVDGVAICDRLLYLLDGIKYTTDDPMANQPKNTKIRPTPKKKKKQPKTRSPTKTRTPPKTTMDTNSNNTNKMKTKKRFHQQQNPNQKNKPTKNARRSADTRIFNHCQTN